MALRVTMHCIDDVDLSWDAKKGDVRGLDAAYREASRLTDVSMSTLREKFLSFLDPEGATYIMGDNSTRGRASASCDRTKLRKLSTAHCDAIRTFIAYRNSSKGAGKVCVARVGGTCSTCSESF